MKRTLSFIAAASLLASVLSPVEARDSVSVDFFYNNLESHGSWQEVGDYGYCWTPSNVGRDWRPYSDGRWVYTDAGWTWDSDEAFGWAVYHYGRWAEVDRVGWVWVPGTDWGPGWVSWRRSSSHVGWAPLPPEARFRINIGFSGWVDDYYNIGPSSYRFVEGRNFGSRRLNTVFVDQRQNISIINQTTNITNITYMNGGVHNGGLRYEDQARLSSEPIRRYKLDRRQDYEGDPRYQADDRFRSRIEGESLSMLALPIAARAIAPPRKVSEKISAAQINRGWNNAGSPEEVTSLRTRMKSKVSAPAELPPNPKFEKITERTAPTETRRPANRLPEKPETPAKDKMSKEREANTPPAPAERKADIPQSRPKVDRGPEKGDDQPKGKMRKERQADMPPVSPPAIMPPKDPAAPATPPTERAKTKGRPERGEAPETRRPGGAPGPQVIPERKPRPEPPMPKGAAPSPERPKIERPQPETPRPQVRPQAPTTPEKPTRPVPQKGKDKREDKDRKKPGESTL